MAERQRRIARDKLASEHEPRLAGSRASTGEKQRHSAVGSEADLTAPVAATAHERTESRVGILRRFKEVENAHWSEG